MATLFSSHLLLTERMSKRVYGNLAAKLRELNTLTYIFNDLLLWGSFLNYESVIKSVDNETLTKLNVRIFKGAKKYTNILKNKLKKQQHIASETIFEIKQK